MSTKRGRCALRTFEKEIPKPQRKRRENGLETRHVGEQRPTETKERKNLGKQEEGGKEIISQKKKS